MQILGGLKGRFSAVVTSPPYADLQDYGIENQIGFGQSIREYLRDLGSVFEACADLTTDHAAMWLVVGALRRDGEVVLLPEMVAAQARAGGWKIREVITWEKSKGLPFTKYGEFRDVTENAILLSKTNNYQFDPSSLFTPEPQSPWWIRYPERYSPEGTRPTNVWRISIPTQGSWRQGPAHSCPFPHELTYRMVSVITEVGDLVLDPFAGVGSVPALSQAMGRPGYGLDLSPGYVAQYPAVQADASGWWITKTRMLAQSDLRRAIFRDAIVQLRLLKFARLTMQKLSRCGLDPEWIRVANYRNGDRIGHKFIFATYEIGYQGQECERLLRLVSKATSQRPLSKFGIEANFRIEASGCRPTNARWFPDCRFWKESTEDPSGSGHLVADFAPAIAKVRSWQVVPLSAADADRTE